MGAKRFFNRNITKIGLRGFGITVNENDMKYFEWINKNLFFIAYELDNYFLIKKEINEKIITATHKPYYNKRDKNYIIIIPKVLVDIFKLKARETIKVTIDFDYIRIDI